MTPLDLYTELVKSRHWYALGITARAAVERLEREWEEANR